MATKNEMLIVAEMLQSINMAIEYPETSKSKADVMRALLGSVEPPRNETQMIAICTCGWRGTMQDAIKRKYDSGLESWSRLGGRRGWRWYCPDCDVVVWRYYWMIS